MKKALALAFLSLASCIPLFLYPLPWDTLYHLLLIECYGDAIWSVEWLENPGRPLWCPRVDHGQGSPVALFYFPLPYFISTVFYPLTWFGVSLSQLFGGQIWLAGMVAGAGCLRWLTPLAGRRAAWVGAMLYLLMPYRVEVMSYRSTIAEMWLLAFLPYVLHFVRALLLKAQMKDALGLAFFTACCVLSQISTWAVVMLALAGWIAVLQWRQVNKRGLLLCMGAVALGVCAASFYLLPVYLYQPFIYASGEIRSQEHWANNTISPDNLDGQMRQLFGFALTILFAAVLTIRVWWSKRSLPAEVRGEMAAWCLFLLMGAVLPWWFSEWFWSLFKWLPDILFPWRMQAVVMLAAVYFCALRIGWLLSPKQEKTFAFDTGLMLAFFMLLSHFLVGMRDEKQEALYQEMRDARLILATEYRTIWTSEDAYAREKRLSEPPSPIRMAEGEGTANRSVFSSHGAVIEADVTSPTALLRIGQRYFPFWQASDAQNNPLPLEAEEGSGLMLLPLAEGEHHITIQHEIQPPFSTLISAANLCSMLTWLVMGVAWLHYHRKSLKRKHP